LAIEIILWSDVNNKLKIDRTGDVKIDKNLEAIVDAVENILLTQKGERVMRPTVGSLLNNYLFEPIAEPAAHKIGLEVLDALRQEDRINVKAVEVVANERIGGYEVKIDAVVKELNLPFVFERVLLL
jgi:phage baseplate assembly protein W